MRSNSTAPNDAAPKGALPKVFGQRRGRRPGIGAAVVLCGLLVAGMTGAGPGRASAASSAGPCLASTRGVSVHFTVAGTRGPEAGIDRVSLSGFDPASCDGRPVEVVLSGNRAGDPSSPATELLSTLDSTKNPCTGAALTQPLTIRGGAITLTGCASTVDPQRAAYANVHDVTRLQVRVNGQPIPIGGGTAVSAPHGPPGNAGGTAQAAGGNAVSAPQVPAAHPEAAASSAPSTGLLPNTGGPAIWFLLLAVALVGVGSMLARTRPVGSARRRRTPTLPPTGENGNNRRNPGETLA